MPMLPPSFVSVPCVTPSADSLPMTDEEEEEMLEMLANISPLEWKNEHSQ
jgi:hypothetical protein